MSVLQVKHLTMKFGGITAVNDLSLTVQEGQVFSVIGPNGAGKTTVFNVVTGIYAPTSGTVEFHGDARIKPLTPGVVVRCVLVGLLVGFDNILSPILDTAIQQNFPSNESRIYRTFTGWRLCIFGLALILMMRFRPEGLIASSRVKHELHPDEAVAATVHPVTLHGNRREPEGQS